MWKRLLALRQLCACLLRIVGVFSKQRRDRDLAAELEAHLQMHVDDNIRAGMSPEGARQSAVLKLGGADQTKEAYRDRRSLPVVDTLVQDLRYSARTLGKNPGFTVSIVLALALGIGANTAIFSVVNAVLLRPLRAPDADRLVRFAMTYQGTPTPLWGVGLSTFNTWRQQTGTFDDVSAHWSEFANLTNGSYPEQIPVARVSAPFFYLFGAPVLKGRTFTAQEDRPGGSSVAVLSHELWRRQFGADPDILGKTVVLGGESRVVVGVLDAGFDSEQFDQRPDVWVPFQVDPNNPEKGPGCFVTGRLRSGVTLAAGRAQLQTVAKNEPPTPELKDVRAGMTVVPLRDAMVGDVRSGLLILVVAVGFVLLIACANVAGLLLVRAVDQRREIAIRAAIGAGRGRIVRQLLTESFVLAVAGGMLGLVLGTTGIRALLATYPGNNDPGIVFSQLASLPRIGHDAATIAIDWRVWLFTAGVSVVTGFLFGLLPAIHAGRTDLSTALKTGPSDARPGGNKMRALLVIGEIALALTLLAGSGLLIRTSFALLAVKRGFDVRNVLTMRMSVTGTRFDTQAGIEQLTRDGIERVRAIPGVDVATAACCVPLEAVWQLPFIMTGRPLSGRWHAFAGWTFVSPGYFEALNVPLIRGRTFTVRDGASAAGVVIINQEMAQRFWPNTDPLRDQLMIGRGMRPEFAKDGVRQIVGIVGNVRDQALNRPARPAVYVPTAQLPDGVTTFFMQQLPLTWMVRTSVEPHALSRRIERELQTASDGLPVTRIQSLDQVTAQSIARTRFSTLMLTIFGCLSVLLAVSGIYGLIAFSAKRRVHEIGIRMALGARAHDIQRMLLLEGLRVALVGVGIGVVLALGLTRLLASLLFGVTPHDLFTFAAVPALLVAVILVAVWVPARRATRVDPLIALRAE